MEITWAAKTSDELQAEYQEWVQKVQVEFTGKIQEAQAASNYEEVMTLSTKMQEVISAGVQSYQARLEELSQQEEVSMEQSETVSSQQAGGGTVDGNLALKQQEPPAQEQAPEPPPAQQKPEPLVTIAPKPTDKPYDKKFDAQDDKNQMDLRQNYQFKLTDVDLDLAVYDGDRDGISEFINDTHFMENKNALLEEAKFYDHNLELLKRSIKIDPRVAPKLQRTMNKCKEALNFKGEIDFYLYQNQYFNATVYPPDAKGKFAIALTSSLFEKFTEAELTFIVGHEIGHFLYNHNQMPVHFLLHHGGHFISPIQAMKLFSWCRNAEVSADRVGLMCCRDFNAATSAFFKLSSGVTSDSIEFTISDYLAQFSNLKELMGSADSDPNDWYTTHPFSPLRIKALDIFHRSETFKKLVNQTGGEIPEAEMEDQIKDFMSLLEPSYLKDESEAGAVIQEFILVAGYALAAANGVIEDSEIEALCQLVSKEVVDARVPELKKLNIEGMFEKLAGMSKQVDLHLSAVQVCNLVRDLAIITYADGEVDAQEMQVLYGICHHLRINPRFADQVIYDASQGLD